MFYVGIDPASNTGVVVLDDKGGLIRSQMVQTKRKGPAKLMDLRDGVKALIETFTPRLTAIENYAFGSPFGREQAGEIGGTLRLLLYEHDCTIVTVAPDTLKLFVTGDGHADKEDMKDAVRRKWGVEFKGNKKDTSDLADAYGLARIAWLIGTDQTEGLEKTELRALETVRKGMQA